MGETPVIRNPEFERSVMAPLLQLGRRLRAYTLIGGVGAVMVFVLLAATGQLILDFTLRLPRDMRLTLLFVIVLGAAWVFYKRFWLPLRVPIGPRELAGLVERRHKGLGSTLVSAVQFAGGEVGADDANSPELVKSVIERGARAARTIRFDEVIQFGQARQGVITVIAVLAVGAAGFALQPELMGIWFERNVLLSNTPYPRQTLLSVDADDGVVTAARGDDVEIRGSARGVVPREVDIRFEATGGDYGRETMVRVGRRDFRHTFKRVEEELRFRLRGGDDETEWFQLRLADRPRVDNIAIRVTPPAYSGAEPFNVPAGERSAEALLGSVVRLDITLNKPIARAELFAGQEHVADASGDATRWSVSITPHETRTYHFVLEDDIGLENKRPVRVAIRVLKDSAPRVQMKAEGVGDFITSAAVLPLDLSFTDTYGLSAAELVYEVVRDGSTPVSESLDGFNAGMKVFDLARSWPVAKADVAPGSRLTLFAQARDFDDVSGPNESQSTIANFNVVTTDELLAELARREQEYRQEFERVIADQEELRGELLTLIRKLDDGRIDDDVSQMERRQRQIAGQVNMLRQQFERILLEYAVNGLDTRELRERLGDLVITPMTQIARRDLNTAADLLKNFARDPVATAANKADTAQLALLNEMRRILANMLKWEGYQEAVTMLREILRLQNELNRETQDEIERRAADIFEDQ
jgi:regulator of replication initiation timing